MEEYTYQPEVVRPGVYRLRQGDMDKNLVLIHGLNGSTQFRQEPTPDPDHMREIYEWLYKQGALEGKENSKGYTVWSLTYETHVMPFIGSGGWLAHEVKQLSGYSFTDAIVVGYSMGGLIARTMLCYGFDFKYLVTIDTPHHGPTQHLNSAAWAGWFLFPFVHVGLGLFSGINSLIIGSVSQNFIHNNPIDQAKRATSYACYAIRFREHETDAVHGDDWVVPVGSQLGLDMGEVRWRMVWDKLYTPQEPFPGMLHPHVDAAKPVNCEPALQLIKELLAGKPMPARTLETVPESSQALATALDTTKLPVEAAEWSAWYWFNSANVPQVRLRCRLLNQDTKPIRVSWDKFLKCQAGPVRPLDTAPELVLVPKVARVVTFAVDYPVAEMMPETLEVACLGEIHPLPFWFVPLEVDASGVLPTESIWQLELAGKVTYKTEEDGYYTNVRASLQVTNPTPVSFYLDASTFALTLDVTEQPAYGFLYDTTLTADSRVQLRPTQTTDVTVGLQWVQHAGGSPNKATVTLGGSIMPVAQREFACEKQL